MNIANITVVYMVLYGDYYEGPLPLSPCSASKFKVYCFGSTVGTRIETTIL